MSGSNKQGGFFRRAANAFVAAREAEARRYTRSYLSSLDNERLAEIGLSRRTTRGL